MSQATRHRPFKDGLGTTARTVGLLGGMLTCAVEQGIIEKKPAHSIPKPADRIKNCGLNEDEYRLLGNILDDNRTNQRFQVTVEIIRFLGPTGCRHGEAIRLKWPEVDQRVIAAPLPCGSHDGPAENLCKEHSVDPRS
jgi:hypothetical protein